MSLPPMYIGPMGQALHMPLSEKVDPNGTTVTWWLLTGPWHPLWPQFVLYVVHLRDYPGMPEPAKLHFPGATHELVVLALNPGDPPRIHPPAQLAAEGLGTVGHLSPVDVVHQFTATDEEMVQLAEAAARACVTGLLAPSTDAHRPYYREQWLTACVRTLAHIRGEEHAP